MSEPGLLLFGDTVRSPALRHELPVSVVDALLYVETGGRRHVLTSVLERDRIAEVAPDAEVHLLEEHGFDDVLAEGLGFGAAVREVAARTVSALGVREALVPADLPVALADRLRADGVVLRVDDAAVAQRRRVKTERELAGIRNAQAAAHHGMEAAAQLLRDARVRDGVLHRGPVVLTCDDVRDRVRAACAAHGAPAPADVIVRDGLRAHGGHDPGSGPLYASSPIVVDVWPCDEASGCWADMTRTFVVGEVPDAVAAHHALVLDALRAATEAIRPGVAGVDAYGAACDVFEAAGHPTQRTKEPGRPLSEGFYFSLGHGVGLEVHEEPSLGRGGHDTFVAGDVVAIEPGTTMPGVGEVRVEDLLLVTAHGTERLTDFPYGLAP